MKTEPDPAAINTLTIGKGKAGPNEGQLYKPHGSTAKAFHQWLLDKLYAAIGKPPIRIVLWNGVRTIATRDPPVATLHFKDAKTLIKILIYPELFFGLAYVRGDVKIEGDLVDIVKAVLRQRKQAPRANTWLKLLRRRLSLPHGNNLSATKQNIHHHYNIGSDFYRLWLDREMVYTCAYFPSPSYTLGQAQIAKMEHICRKLQLQPGHRVVEAGCGWGALALYMAKNYGVTVKAYNISHEQIQYAQQRADQEGLRHRVEFIEDDYRNILGTYDNFVSVGMLEHVGLAYYQQLAEIINHSLKPSGRGLLHFIGRNRPAPLNPWLEKYIFPGAYPPTLREALTVLEQGEFSVLDIENLRLHYAKTLEHWLNRFETSSGRIQKMFDEEFVKAYRFYLAGSIAVFLTGDMQLFQVSFVHAGNNQIPWSRDHLYH